MSRLDVSDDLIRELVGEVTPLVVHLTGWNLRCGDLGHRVLPRDRGYEEIVLGRLSGAGIRVEADPHQDPIARLMEHMIESNILAAYDHGRQEILVVRENVDDSNLDGLRLVLCHELVHRGQHIHHAPLFSRVDQVIRDAFVAGSDGDAAVRDALEEIDAIMTLFESHAHFVELEIKRLYLPHGVVESHFDMLSLIFHYVGQQKLSQYVEGIPAISSAVRSGTLDALFRSFEHPR